MYPEEIKFRVLYTMYCQHFLSGGLANATDRGIAIEAGLEDIDPNELRSQIDALTKNGLLKIGGRGEGGYQVFIGLEPDGIKTAQKMAEDSLRTIPAELKDEFRSQLEKIHSEKDITKKTKRFFDFVLQEKSLAGHVFNIAKKQLC